MKEFFNQRFFKLFCWAIIAIQFLLIVYFQRGVFLKVYDVAYWEDRVAHSQWFLPLSNRLIGDDGLFAYVGYQLINGADPSGLNAETPALGKYFIGLSILLFGNPDFHALFLGLAALPLFYLVARRFLSQNTSLFLVSLLFLDPLFFTQLWHSWVDLPQLFFLLAHIVFFLWFLKSSGKKSLLLMLLSGFTLGLFTQTKPAVLFPAIVLMGTLYLFLKLQLREMLIFFAGIVGAVLLVYSKYFLLGNSIIDFLKFQKYVASFYTSSKIPVHFDAIWQTLLVGKFPGIATGVTTQVVEWWLFWPFAALLGIGSAFYIIFKREELPLKGLAIFLVISLFIYSFIPSYPRYLIVVIPFLYFFSVFAIEKFLRKDYKFLIFSAIILYGLYNSFTVLIPSPDPLIRNFSYNLSRFYFHDIYQEDLAKISRPSMTRGEFHALVKKVLEEEAQVKAIEVREKERSIPRFGEKGSATFIVKYKTQHMGEFEEEKEILLIRENSQWKIIWDWDILLDGFRPGYSLETTTVLGKRGTIKDVNGFSVARDEPGYLISVNPEMIDKKREKEMAELISAVGYKGVLNLQNAYLEDPLSGEYIPLVTTFRELQDGELEELLSLPGLRVTAYPSRLYSGFDPGGIQNVSFIESTRIYSSFNYRGVHGPEREFDDILFGYSGGNIVLKNEKGEVVRTILEKQVRNGENVTLPYEIIEPNK